MEPEPVRKAAIFQPKQSRANTLWVCTIVVVLVALFFETRGKPTPNYNCCVSTNSESIGAEVFIDSKKVGAVARDEKGGLGGGSYRCSLSAGHHLIEVRKALFTPLSFDVFLRKELYLEANLEKTPG